MRLIVLMAVSGAGKDHFVAHFMPEANTVASADDYFMRDGKYRFDGDYLYLAHGACFRKVLAALQEGVATAEHTPAEASPLIVVNNTNTTIAEIAPYMMAAQAYGAEASITCLRIAPLVAAKRNVHGVGLTPILKMAERLEKTLTELPPWWGAQVLNWDVETSQYR